MSFLGSDSNLLCRRGQRIDSTMFSFQSKIIGENNLASYCVINVPVHFLIIVFLRGLYYCLFCWLSTFAVRTIGYFGKNLAIYQEYEKWYAEEALTWVQVRNWYSLAAWEDSGQKNCFGGAIQRFWILSGMSGKDPVKVPFLITGTTYAELLC